MKEALQQILDEAKKRLQEAQTLQDAEDVRVKMLGKKGQLTGILKSMGSLTPEERKELGMQANKAKGEIEAMLNRTFDQLKERAQEAKFKAEKIDVTEPGKEFKLGTKHPVTITIEEISKVFKSMGFTLTEGPEVETVYNNFDALTQEEKKLYDNILIMVKDHKAIINRLSGSISYRTPDISAIATDTPPQVPVAVPVEEDTGEQPEAEPEVPQPEVYEDDLGMIPQEDTLDMDCMEPEQEQEIPSDELDAMVPQEKAPEPAPQKTDDSDYIVVRVLEDLDTFSGPLRDYTLHKEEIVRLPEMFAQALVNRNLAVKVSMSP